MAEELPTPNRPESSEQPQGDGYTLDRAGEIFHAVRGMGLAAREEAIDRMCGKDAALMAMVRLLLKGDQAPLHAEGLAEDIRAAHDALTRATSSFQAGPSSSGIDATHVGNYKLLERIGEGGFGVVYMAQQEQPVRRRVALKIVKLGMDTKQVVARFEAERQALALMDHPSIARVFDAGATTTGRPYFVMELVKGLPITEYCDKHKLNIQQRLALILQVCDALQHAHQRGVIHRDIKPSNVLVSTTNDKAVPKIIDFGIAKATTARLTEKTVFTEFRQMIGTPEYMSPEQAGESNEDVDTRTDVYSTGVLLYELLVGATPFDSRRLRSAAFGEMQRIIREEDPPKPSTRLSTLVERSSHAERALRAPRSVGEHPTRESMHVASASAAGGAEGSSKFRPADLAGELDWIVMKALEKDRTRRYESASAMAADIQRFLTGHAVHAAPPDAWYRAKKFIRRNKAPVIAASLLTCALIAGLVGTSLGFFRAEKQRKVAVSERDRADEKTKEAVLERERADENATQARAAEVVATRNAYAANLMSASAAVNDVQFSTARAFLDTAPEPLRGWEWRVLHARLDTSVRTLRIAPQPHNYEFPELFMHADGRSFFTSNPYADPCVQLWDLETGRLLQSFPSPAPAVGWNVSSAAASIDGQRLTTLGYSRGGDSGGLSVDSWNLTTGVRIARTNIPFARKGQVNALVSSDGSRVHSFTLVQARSFDVATGAVVSEQQMQHLEVPMGSSRDSTLFATTIIKLPYGRIVVREADSLKSRHVLEGHSGMIESTAFSDDNRWLASAADDSSARVWDLAAAPPSSIVLPHPFKVVSARFSPNATLVATGTIDRAIRVWDRASGRLLKTFASDLLNPEMFMFMPDSRQIAACDTDGTVRCWDITTESTSVLRGHKSIVSNARWAAPETGLIVSASWEGADGSLGIVRMSDADSGEEVAMREGRLGDVVYAMDVSADGRFAAAGITSHIAQQETLHSGRETKAGRIEIIDLVTGNVLATPSMLHVVPWLAFGAGDQSLIAADYDNDMIHSLHVIDSRTGVVTRSRELDQRCVWNFGLSPDGQTVAAVQNEELNHQAGSAQSNTILLIDSQTLETVREIDGAPGAQYSIAFSADGTRLATGGGDGLLRLYDFATGKLITSMSGHGMHIRTIAFSPDGSRIASAGMDRRVRIWNADTFEQVAVFEGHEGHIGNLDWDEMGQRLLSCSGDFTVRVWEARPVRDRVAAKAARTAALAVVEPRVSKWFDELGEPAKVIERIKADKTLTELQRKTALQVVLKRGLKTQPEAKK